MPLEWTGERFIPGLAGSPLYYEHAHRYAFAAKLADRQVVLDVGSGEGYGAALLASVARTVFGVDIASEAATHTKKAYGDLDNLFVGISDAESLPFASNSIDVVTCFEVIEHVRHPLKVLAEVQRVLRQGGLFVVSTPDKAAYSASRNEEPNEFHLSEMHLHEFRSMLAQHFSTVTMMGQRLIGSSVMWQIDGSEIASETELLSISSVGSLQSLSLPDAVPLLYAVAVCTNDPAASLPVRPSLFIDRDAPLFDETITRMEHAQQQLGLVAAELERLNEEAANLRAALATSQLEVQKWQTEAYLLRSEIETERASVGGALLARYRRAIERAAPSGSIRRRAYLLAPRTLRYAQRRISRRSPHSLA